jgi:hypothetical protein
MQRLARTDSTGRHFRPTSIAPDDGSGGFQLYSPIRGMRAPATGFDTSKYDALALRQADQLACSLQKRNRPSSPSRPGSAAGQQPRALPQRPASVELPECFGQVPHADESYFHYSGASGTLAEKSYRSKQEQLNSTSRLIRTPTHWGANQQQNWMKTDMRSTGQFSRDAKAVLHIHSHDHDLQPDVAVWHRNHEYADAEHAMHADFHRKEEAELARRTEMRDIELAHEHELMEAHHKLLAKQMEHHPRPGDEGYQEPRSEA